MDYIHILQVMAVVISILGITSVQSERISYQGYCQDETDQISIFDAVYGATVQSLEQCEGECSDRPECTAFVHGTDYCGLYNGGPATGGDGRDGHTCYLKEGEQAETTPAPTTPATNGPILLGAGDLCEDKGLYPLMDYNECGELMLSGWFEEQMALIDPDEDVEKYVELEDDSDEPPGCMMEDDGYIYFNFVGPYSDGYAFGMRDSSYHPVCISKKPQTQKTYSLANQDGICSDIGAETIADYDECYASLEDIRKELLPYGLGYSFYNETDDYYPPGCSMEYDGYIYWNNNFDNATTFTGGEYYRQICKASCNDGLQNAKETGVDCGGPNCPACQHCSDGKKNEDEEGKDCGGSCPPCQAGPKPAGPKPAECKDKLPKKRCHQARMQGKCKKAWYKTQCCSTCGTQCSNIWMDSKCAKLKFSCARNRRIRQKCKKTCKVCKADPCAGDVCNGNVCKAKAKGGVYCDCSTTGMTGPTCDTDPCDNDACNGNACTVDYKGGFLCDCSTTGLSGKTCDEDPCSDDRCNGGVCTPDASAWGGFTCNCTNIQFDGYTSTMYGYTCNLDSEPSCFDETTTVWTKSETQSDEDARNVLITMLKEGDLVGTSNLNRKLIQPNGFQWTRATSVDIVKNGNWTAHSFLFTNDSNLTVTSPHIMIVWNDDKSYMVRADQVKVGDAMIVDESIHEVQSIKTYIIDTKVNVETEDGTIKANGVLASGFCDVNPGLLVMTPTAEKQIEDYTKSHFKENIDTCMDVNSYGSWYNLWMDNLGYSQLSY